MTICFVYCNCNVESDPFGKKCLNVTYVLIIDFEVWSHRKLFGVGVTSRPTGYISTENCSGSTA